MVEVSEGIRLLTSGVSMEFSRMLARSHRWERLYIVSPWLSLFEDRNGIGFDTLLRRVRRDDATLYVLTRPPEEDWHRKAVERILQTSRTHLAYAPGLHAKIYYAETRSGEFSVFGSANFTARSNINQELGLVVSGKRKNERVLNQLKDVARGLYRQCPGRIQVKRGHDGNDE